MTALIEGPFLAVSGLLAAAGADKALRPQNTATALSSAGLPATRPMVRAAAVAELAIGAGAAVSGAPPLAAAVALSYAGFAVFVAVARARRWPLSTCGCFTTVDTPPTWGHVLLDAAAAAVAGVAAGRGVPTLAGALSGPLALGLALLIASGAAAGGLFLLMTLSPRLGAVRRSPSGGAP